MDIPQEGYHEIKFADSGSYKGYFKNGMPEGFGESRDPSGNTYSGDFHEVRLGDRDKGMPHGRGTHVWATGERYEGEYRNGKQNGYGRWTHPMGDMYEGYFRDDKRHGEGTYTTSKGQTWTGHWIDGKQGRKGDAYMEIRRPVWASTLGQDTYDSVTWDRGDGMAEPTYDLGRSGSQMSRGQAAAASAVPDDVVELYATHGEAGIPARQTGPGEGYDRVHAPRPGAAPVAARGQPSYDHVGQGGEDYDVVDQVGQDYDVVEQPSEAQMRAHQAAMGRGGGRRPPAALPPGAEGYDVVHAPKGGAATYADTDA